MAIAEGKRVPDFAQSESAGRNVAVLGISPDLSGSHANFASKFKLPFVVLRALAESATGRGA